MGMVQLRTVPRIDVKSSHPSSRPARLNHTVNRKQIGGVAKRQAAVFGDVVHGAKCRRETAVEPFEYLIAAPVVIGRPLHLLEIAASDAPRVGQDIGNEENAAIIEGGVSARCRWAVGPFGHNLDAAMHATDIRIRDLVLERRRNQDVDVLFELG